MSETAELPADLVFLDTLQKTNGYILARPIGRGRYACIAGFAYTTAIIVGRIGDATGFEDRWCFHRLGDAIAALLEWDGTGEPKGWHRQPGTGRRLAESDDCYDDDGNLAPIGTIYVRR